MTSTTSLNKLFLFELKKRAWAYVIMLLAILFVQPVSLLMTIENMEMQSYFTRAEILRNISYHITQWFGNRGVLFALTGFACAMICFAFVYNRASVDLYHSLAIRREKLFLVKYLSAILPVLLIQFIGLLLTLLVLSSKGYMTGILYRSLLMESYRNLVAFFLYLHLTIIAIMLTGRLVIGVFGALTLAGYAMFLSVVLKEYYSAFLQTYFPSLSDQPIWLLLLDPSSVFGRNFSTTNDVSGLLFILLVEAAVLFAVSLALYRLRPSEKTNVNLCYHISKPIIRIPVVLLAALCGGIFVFRTAYALNAFWYWSAFIVCGLLAHLTIELIYEQDIRKLFAHPVQLAAGLLTAAVIALVFQYDLTSYDRFIPKQAKVESVGVQFFNLENEIGYFKENPDALEEFERWQYQDPGLIFLKELKLPYIDDAVTLANAGISNLNPERSAFARRRQSVGQIYEPEPEMLIYAICYHYRSGKDVYRTYHAPVEQVYAAVANIYESREFKETLYPLSDIVEKGLVTTMTASGYSDTPAFTQDDVNLKKFLRAYEKDLENRNLNTLKERPIMRLQSYDMKTYMNFLSGYCLYESDSNTVSYLKSVGIDIAEHKFNLTPEQITTIVLHDYSGEDGYNAEAVTLTMPEDRERIEETLSVLIPQAFCYSNNVLHPCNQMFDAEVNYINANGMPTTCYCTAPYGVFP